MMMTNHSINRDLQCLRAFAILLVVMHHTVTNLVFWQSEFFDMARRLFNGGVGVDLFLVISGFIITKGLYQRLIDVAPGAEAKQELLYFWLKRVWRLLPSAWFWLGFPLLFVVFFNDSGVWGASKTAFESALAGFLNIANFRFGNCFMTYPCGPFAHYWSLSLEEQFYLLLPLAIYFLRNYFRVVLTVLIVLIICVPALWPPFFVRVDGLLLGVWIALLSQQTRDTYVPAFLGAMPMRLLFWPLMLALLAMVTASGVKLGPSIMFMFKFAALLSAGMVFIASFDRDYVVRNDSLAKVLVFIGDRSYTLYLTHFPAMNVTKEIFYRMQGHLETVPVVYYGLVFVALLLLFTEASYRLLEIPLRNKGRSIVKQMQNKTALAD